MQLGIWVVSHFAWLRLLVRNREQGANGGMGEDGEVQLPILPLMMAKGHYWKIMVAEAIFELKAKDIKVATPRDLRLGSTDTVLGIYQPVEAVSRLAR